jgi:hypothetical protein
MKRSWKPCRPRTLRPSITTASRLREKGHFIAAQALEFVKAGAVVRRQGDKVSVTDGPFAETSEQVGGFILVEAKDRDEAIRLASKIPVIEFGRVEVRPVRELV